MTYDGWLDPWLELLRERAAGRQVLEIGCGAGHDTAVLCGAGLEVTAFDLSDGDVRQARERAPAARITRRDLREPWPDDWQAFGAVVASLSLHYFAWDETRAQFTRIARALGPGGLFLLRLNAHDDHHYGASGHPRIAPGYYLVDGQPKRFFDEAALDSLRGEGWSAISSCHRLSDKYGQPKALWECVWEREGAP